MNGDGVLIVGYGNVLRSDDGVGWHAAQLLAARPELAAADVRALHQLTPELAEAVSTARLAVLVDACADAVVAGSVRVDPVRPAPAGADGWTHLMTPGALVHLSRLLYGAAARVLLVSVGVRTVAHGTELSPEVADALPDVVATVLGLVEERAYA